MEPIEHLLLEVDAVERCLSRRAFLKAAVLVPVLPGGFSPDDRRFVEGAVRALIPSTALAAAGVDVAANVEHLLQRANADHRLRVLRALRWARRISFLYGGHLMPLRARGSRFLIVRRLTRALSVACLVAFWGDERTLALIADPAEPS
jgi:hypothetical protein